MRYVVILGGHTDALKDIAPFFARDSLKIRQLQDRWVIESSDLDACTPDEVSGAASQLLSRLHELLALYVGLYSPFEIATIHVLDDRGELVNMRSGPVGISINVTRPADVLGPAGPGSLGSRVLSKANDNPAIREALSLVGEQPLSWARIYDIIEFLGRRAISQSGLASEPEVDRVGRTANHYRHLGNPKPNPLPANAPTLREAGNWACDLVRKWISNRL
jgi:hypothetical protein